MVAPPEHTLERLHTEHNIWMATVRPQGQGPHATRPHLAPVWFAWHGGKLYVCIEKHSVKGRNLMHNPLVSLSLEDGSKVVICEGEARPVPLPWPEPVEAIFQQKYAWEISPDGQYDWLVEITPHKWLVW